MREKLPRITSLKVLANHRLSLHFQDGWTVIVALGAFIDACPVLAPLRDRTLFRKAKLEEWGSGVTWDDEPLGFKPRMRASNCQRTVRNSVDRAAADPIQSVEVAVIKWLLTGSEQSVHNIANPMIKSLSGLRWICCELLSA
jgi:hypothetical protein